MPIILLPDLATTAQSQMPPFSVPHEIETTPIKPDWTMLIAEYLKKEDPSLKKYDDFMENRDKIRKNCEIVKKKREEDRKRFELNTRNAIQKRRVKRL